MDELFEIEKELREFRDELASDSLMETERFVDKLDELLGED
jgi:hypothetical protein